MVTAVSRKQDLDLAGSSDGPEPIGIDVTRRHVTSWCHGTGRGLCPGPGNVLRSSGVSAPELCGLGPLRGYDQVVDPHGLIDGRTPPDVGPDDELGELEVGPGSRPIQHVVAVDDQVTIEPVLYHAVRNTHAAADAVDLQVDLDVVPVTLVARGTGRRLERDRPAAVELLVVVRPAPVAFREEVALHDAVAAAHGPIFRDADQVHRQAAVARV